MAPEHRLVLLWLGALAGEGTGSEKIRVPPPGQAQQLGPQLGKDPSSADGYCRFPSTLHHHHHLPTVCSLQDFPQQSSSLL